MIEILFKGKRIDNNEWIEGFYLPIGERTYIICEAELDCTDGENTDLYTTEWYEVDPETICQYTGWVDKNGRRYEGDIFQVVDIECACIWRYVIKWDDKLLRWSANNIEKSYIKLPLSDFRIEEINVIGNVFDNSELLEEAAG